MNLTRRGSYAALLAFGIYLTAASWLGSQITQSSTRGAGEAPRVVVPVAVPSSPARHAPLRATPTAASRSRVVVAPPATGSPVHKSWTSGHLLDVTAYCWTGNRTASGVWPQIGMAAGNTWPFGTRLHVEGVGIVEVTDRYGHGTQLDIYMGREGCERRASNFGRQQLLVSVIR